ncbi:MAG: YbbR-like domain-containing protein [Muribaculaceae bacterium]|nr:YbbR-like domain-containing protein [Muribaculaceae bacterium]
MALQSIKHKYRNISRRVEASLKSKQGHNFMTFMVFVAIAAALWGVMTLNEESTFDLRVPIRLTQVPDSVTVISDVPDQVQVTATGKGTQLLRYLFGHPATANIDFRLYRSPRGIRLGDAEMKSIVRSSIGGANAQLISPDSLIILYTSAPPVLLPVELDCNATTAPGCTMVGHPTLSIDSARVYSAQPLSRKVTAVITEPLRFDNISSTVSRRVRLLPPVNGSRVVPDSATLTIAVEPLIIKSRSVVIEGINAPDGGRLITFPAKVDVIYMIPMSAYTKSAPEFKVIADYADRSGKGDGRVKLRIRNVPAVLQNVRLDVDSVDYYISK